MGSALGLACAACSSQADGPRPMGAKRVVQVAAADSVRFHASSDERFGFRMPGASEQAGATDPGSVQGAGLHYDLPEGWVELPARSMRAANFLVSGDERAECYLTVLSGDGGGLEANVSRWLSQMSAPPMTSAQISALPRWEFFGGDALVLDVEGTWTGMGGEQSGEGYRMLGLLKFEPGRSVFLKAVGPASVMESQVEALRTLAASFHEGGDGHDHGQPASAGAAPGASTGTAVERSGAESAGELTWATPEGWKRAPDRAMREVTYHIGEGELTECYVTVLGGDGGGAQANIDRWRKQMGQEPITPAGFDELESFTMLGARALLAEVEGSYKGMSGEDVSDALLLGAACRAPIGAVFVKMVGPRSVVEAQREAFRTFCGSLSTE